MSSPNSESLDACMTSKLINNRAQSKKEKKSPQTKDKFLLKNVFHKIYHFIFEIYYFLHNPMIT